MQQDDEQPITIEELAEYPEGTVGKAFHAFLQEHGFSPDQFPVHDLIHVITGVEPEPAGEEVAIVYDYALRDVPVGSSAEEELGHFMAQVKKAVASLRAGMPKYAAYQGKELAPYKVACDWEIQRHYLTALATREYLAERLNKEFRQLSTREILALDNSMFDELREMIAEIRSEHLADRVTIFPPADVKAFPEACVSWIMSAGDALNLDDFTGRNFCQ